MEASAVATLLKTNNEEHKISSEWFNGSPRKSEALSAPLGRAPTYAGVEAGVHVMKAQLGPVDMDVGVGVDTGVGVKDHSLSAKVLGVGFSIGKETSVSVFGSKIGVNFGRCVVM